MTEESAPFSQRNWQSVRTVLEALILMAVVWLASTSLDQVKATVELRTQLAGMSDSLTQLRAQLADVSNISRTVAKSEVKLEEHERRLSRLEAEEAVRKK